MSSASLSVYLRFPLSEGVRNLFPFSQPWNKKELSGSMEKATAPHSSTLAWKVPWMEEPHRLRSRGSLGVGCDWAASLSLFTFMHWRKKWQPTPVFLPGESQGRGSLVGCRLWVAQSQTRLKWLSSSSSSRTLYTYTSNHNIDGTM